MEEYREYRFGRKELVLELCRGSVQVIFTGILFFRSWQGCLILFPLFIWILKRRREKKKEERLSNLRLDFKETILSIAASLHAGYSLEQTLPIALEDMKRLHPGEDRPMMLELSWMLRNMELNILPEHLFADLSYRSGLEEIQSFSSVLSIVRRQGGNLVKISRETAEHISKKIQIQMEIEQMIAGKKMEKDIMVLMPYFILIYLQLTSSSYLQPLFCTIYGRVCMGICLIGIYGAQWWADRMIQIPV